MCAIASRRAKPNGSLENIANAGDVSSPILILSNR
jgi:hypothetical protein